MPENPIKFDSEGKYNLYKVDSRIADILTKKPLSFIGIFAFASAMSAWNVQNGNYNRSILWMGLFSVPSLIFCLTSSATQEKIISSLHLLKSGTEIEISLVSGRNLTVTISDLKCTKVTPEIVKLMKGTTDLKLMMKPNPIIFKVDKRKYLMHVINA